MTKQIKNKNIFFFDEEKKLYLDNLHDNKELWHIQWRKQETVLMENFREITPE